MKKVTGLKFIVPNAAGYNKINLKTVVDALRAYKYVITKAATEPSTNEFYFDDSNLTLAKSGSMVKTTFSLRDGKKFAYAQLKIAKQEYNGVLEYEGVVDTARFANLEKFIKNNNLEDVVPELEEREFLTIVTQKSSSEMIRSNNQYINNRNNAVYPTPEQPCTADRILEVQYLGENAKGANKTLKNVSKILKNELGITQKTTDTTIERALRVTEPEVLLPDNNPNK